MYTYTWYQWITFFFLYCFVGWIIESAFVSFHERRFVNRGFLRLPMLPLYGAGAILMLWVALPVRYSALTVFLLGAVAATILEYITGFAMEQLFKMKYWDYTGQPFNLHGYICLGASISWGFLTLLLTYVIHAPAESLVLRLNPVFNIALVFASGLLFVSDAAASVKQALDLGKILETMTKMKTELEELQVQLSLLKSETAQKMAEMKDSGFQRAAILKEEAASRLSGLKAAVKQEDQEERGSRLIPGLSELNERLQAISEKRRHMAEQINFYRKGLLRGNPSSSSKQFGEALKELKEMVKRKKNGGWHR